jgi:Amt family ammonium transporter
MGAEWARTSKPSMLGAISGAVAGLVAVTPASGFVSPGSALLIGLIGGAACHFMTTSVKRRFGYDDSLDVFGVHGVAGTLGALLTGVFATMTVNPIFKGEGGQLLPVGGVDGNIAQVGNQAIVILATWLIAGVGTVAILKLVDLAIGLRVTEQEEMLGLDLTQHGEAAYAFETVGWTVVTDSNADGGQEAGSRVAVSEPTLSESGD